MAFPATSPGPPAPWRAPAPRAAGRPCRAAAGRRPAETSAEKSRSCLYVDAAFAIGNAFFGRKNLTIAKEYAFVRILLAVFGLRK